MKIRFIKKNTYGPLFYRNFRGILGERISFQKNYANERSFSLNVR